MMTIRRETRNATASTSSPQASESRSPETVRTIPNYLSMFRLIGSAILILLAWLQLPLPWLAWFMLLLLSDWLDGKLAKRLDQATAIGAKLDSVADATFYGCVLGSMLWLRWTMIAKEWIWIGLALSSYALSHLVSFAKFGRMASYHTRLAKTSWLFICVAGISTINRWSAWPLRIAMASVFLTNLEAIFITLVLPKSSVNILSLFHALNLRKRAETPPGDEQPECNRSESC